MPLPSFDEFMKSQDQEQGAQLPSFDDFVKQTTAPTATKSIKNSLQASPSQGPSLREQWLDWEPGVEIAPCGGLPKEPLPEHIEEKIKGEYRCGL